MRVLILARDGVLGAFLAVALLAPRPASAQSCTAPSFAAAVNYGAGTNPYAVAVGDFNGDGKADLAAANGAGISILLGNGDGTLRTAVNYGAGVNPSSIAVGDFNGDGKPDLAVANQFFNGTVSILLGKGDGTFQPAVSYFIGTAPQAVAVGDFNGDGKPDLAVANYFFNGTVSILIGRGDGSFQAGASYGTGGFSDSLAVGDFNQDGKTDLAVANATFGTVGTVSILLGNGNGTFQSAANYPAGSTPASVTVGDFNRDGKPDLAVANSNMGAASTVSILLGRGDGSFQSAVDYAAGIGPVSVVVGDFNGDGKPDLAVGNNVFNNLWVLLGNGDGTFQPAVSHSAGNQPISVAVGDFNGDGKLDLAAGNFSSNDVSILLNTFGLTCANASFAAPVTYGAGANPASVAAGDFNRDGKPDLAVANETSHNVSILLGNGDGTFRTAVNYATGTYPVSVAVADFNGDGKPDLAVANQASNNVSILLGSGDGTFRTAMDYGAGANPASVTVADFNGDGGADLAVANQTSNNVSILLGNGDGTFRTAVNYATGIYPASVAVADFNGDGKPDLAVANASLGLVGTVSILLGNGDGTFQSAANYPSGSTPASVTVGDFNGDGKPDLAVANYFFNGTVSILIGRGDGSFQAAASYGTGGFSDSLAVGDFNGDGDADLAVGNFLSGTVSILLGSGDGTFRTTVNYSTGSGSSDVVVGDFNRDGKPDLAVARSGSNHSALYTVSILLNSNCLGRHISLQTDVSSCNTPATPFGTQPGVAVVDDGGNVACDARNVLASIVPGTGTPGATLGGTTTVTPVAGLASYANLSVDLPGRGYRLQFAHPLGTAQSRTFTQGLTGPMITGPPTVGQGAAATYDAGPRYNTYEWVLDGSPIAATQSVRLNSLSLGPHTLQVSVTEDDCGPVSSTMVISVVLPGSACGAEFVVVPDGRLSASVISSGATVWFGASLRMGNSYSGEFKNTTGGNVPPGTLLAFSGDDGCSGASTLTMRYTTGIDPAEVTGAARVSFTAAGANPFFRVSLLNGTGTDIPYTVSVSDTTMFSPAWSTTGSFDTYFAFQNTTGATLGGTLTLYDTAGATLSTFDLSIPAGRAASTNTASLALTRNKTGTARFTHDGPPGSIVAEAVIADFAISPPYVQPVRFEAVREAR